MKDVKKEWYPIPPYKNEGWKIVNENGELIATFELKDECLIACQLFNQNSEQ